ncbi:hypothetical protein [Hymenobacter lucidus]|uniref:Uncharacterized protein n=1 Tax=Hymenobacter lucidus TaxID=2880930 RepID=A0ABS8AQS7_9BACT|nr:hypothetical protein [Hymenobacter lucidus]MCB2407754.1 hypothetical protein [Hymenobacter lucidus]
MAQSQHHSAPTAGPDQPGVHGMLVFGNHRVYASHLPMFRSPHHYQVLLELTLSDSTKAAYKSSQQQFPGETVYTLEPEPFVLPDMLRQPRPFRATLYRGHFERGGTAIARHVTVQIRQVLYAEKLEARRMAKPALLIIGEEPLMFAIHRIARQPDFDQVVALQVPSYVGIRKAPPLLQIVPAKAARRPLKPGHVINIKAQPKLAEQQLTVTRSVYLEHADLR